MIGQVFHYLDAWIAANHTQIAVCVMVYAATTIFLKLLLLICESVLKIMTARLEGQKAVLKETRRRFHGSLQN